MKTAPNNNKQQETAQQIGDINNQQKNTESSQKTVDIEQAFLAYMQQQQITKSDVRDQKLKYKNYKKCRMKRLKTIEIYNLILQRMTLELK